MIGKTVSHYEILEKLGSGGMGVVYKARDIKLDRYVALKFLPPHLNSSDEEKHRFIHEAKAASALDHNNICTIHEIDETNDGQLFIVMGYYDGTTLKEMIKQGPLDIVEAINITTQIAQGLAIAHEAGITHRDIKPANIIITNRNEVKIVDFGLAKLGGWTQLTKTDTTIGTVAYMSPEQARGEEVDHRSDIWSLAVILFEMLAGESPFKADYEQAVIYSILNDDPQPITGLRSGISLELEQILNKALQKDPDLRHQSCLDLLADLKRFTKDTSSKTIKVPQKTDVHKAERKRTRNRWITACITLLVLISGFILLPPIFQEDTLISSPEPLIVMPFENQSGDSSLDYLKVAIPNLLITNLEQSKYITVLTWERMQDLLIAAGRPQIAVENLDKTTAFELCKREGVYRIVMGSYTRAGEVFATDIKVLNVENKKMLVSANSTGNGVGSILGHQIDKLSKSISKIASIPATKEEKEIWRITDLTTTAMEAYRFYLQGTEAYHEWRVIDARYHLQQALNLDSTFAMAWFYMARTQRKLRRLGESMAALRKSYDYSFRATEKEALFINMDYARNIEQNFAKELSINEEIVKKYPKEKLAHYLLGVKYRNNKRLDEAIVSYNRAIELDPNWSDVYVGLGYIYMMQSDYISARSVLEQALPLTPNQINIYDSLAELNLLSGDIDEAIIYCRKALEIDSVWDGALIKLGYIYELQEKYDQALDMYARYSSEDTEPAIRMWGLRHKTVYFFLQGRYQEALDILRSQINLSNQIDDPFRNAEVHKFKALILAEIDQFDAAQQELQTAYDIYVYFVPGDSLRQKIENLCISAFIDLKAGDKESARKKSELVQKNLQNIKYFAKEIYSWWSALLAGEVALAFDQHQNALHFFQIAALPSPYYYTLWPYEHLGAQFTIRDGLARTYYALNDLDKAIEEYKKLITFNPQGTDRFLINPKYHYRLAKLHEKKRWYGLAIDAYSKFLKIWKHADLIHPDIIDAKRRLVILSTQN
jgi:serine/threonine protein kinase/tetratricopeptide (TPR) repeat protein